MRLAVSVVGFLNGRRDGPPVVDSIHLTEEQAATFAPPKDAKVGSEWTIPESIAPPLRPGTQSHDRPDLLAHSSQRDDRDNHCRMERTWMG